MTLSLTRLSQTLLLAGLLLQVSPLEAQPKGADPYAYLTASALAKIAPLPETAAIRPTGRTQESASIHWHGLHVPNAMDGVEGLTQEAIKPAQTFRYEFLASHAGTFMYHSHSHARAIEQIDAGLYGMFVIDPQNSQGHPKVARELLMMLSAWNIGEDGAHEMGGMQYNYFTINGRAYPETPEWTVKRGDVVRVRIANVPNLIHPMHLHGHDFVVLAKDGEPLKTLQTTPAPGCFTATSFTAP